MKRACGILLPISSIPSAYGIGGFTKEAYKFVDFLVSCNQTYWQILPLGPTGYGDSPYQSFSTYAGNPYFIDLDELVKEKVLTKKECKEADCEGHVRYVEYGWLYEKRYALLKKAYKRSKISENPEFVKFVEENADWVKDYALYMAIKTTRFEGKAWIDWAEDIRRRWDYSMDYYKKECAEEVEFYEYLQFKFMQQWKKLKAYANEKGIRIIGDIPIYVALDSADAWAHPDLFQMDEDCKPKAVAGCPPDAFSDDGQLWGNPLYRWDVHKNQNFDWWVKRMKHCYELYDVVRIDHFRGFDEYFSIPYGDKNAKGGHWEKGPGMDLFRALEQRLGKKDVIAEDLGLMTDTVRQLVKDSGYPNMKVLGFAFDADGQSDHLPHCYQPNMVCYTGTHDNETIMQWFAGLDKKTAAFVADYINKPLDPETIRWDIIRLAMLSVADTCIVPMQDYLGFGQEARMNFPSTTGNNWKWRMEKTDCSKALAKEILHLTKLSCRG